MRIKRTLDEALQSADLGAEARAFLAGGEPPSAAQLAEPGVNPTPKPDFTPVVDSPPMPRAAPLAGAPLAITVRLPAELPVALLRVAFERKLRRQHPFTQQEIVAEALRDWLHRHGWQGKEVMGEG